ncbi:hypothetical protein V6N13_092593 [Hibiscus sabdariffa]
MFILYNFISGGRFGNANLADEGNFQVKLGYRMRTFRPWRCSFPFGNSIDGDSEKEPFIAASSIVFLHDESFQAKQGGSIGTVVNGAWFEPVRNSMADKLAAERAQSFTINWYIFFNFHICSSTTEKEIPKKGSDFTGINHYSSYNVQDCMFSVYEPGTGTASL